MKNKITIYAGEPIKRVFAGHEGSVSGKLNRIVDRYALMVKFHGFDISDAERYLLRLAFKDKKRPTARDIQQTEGLILAVDRSDVARGLVKKIYHHRLADLLAVLDRTGL